METTGRKSIMKLTKSHIKQLIKEELSTLKEAKEELSDFAGKGKFGDYNREFYHGKELTDKADEFLRREKRPPVDVTDLSPEHAEVFKEEIISYLRVIYEASRQWSTLVEVIQNYDIADDKQEGMKNIRRAANTMDKYMKAIADGQTNIGYAMQKWGLCAGEECNIASSEGETPGTAYELGMPSEDPMGRGAQTSALRKSVMGPVRDD